jgi:hypothetical protein
MESGSSNSGTASPTTGSLPRVIATSELVFGILFHHPTHAGLPEKSFVNITYIKALQMYGL